MHDLVIRFNANTAGFDRGAMGMIAKLRQVRTSVTKTSGTFGLLGTVGVRAFRGLAAAGGMLLGVLRGLMGIATKVIAVLAPLSAAVLFVGTLRSGEMFNRSMQNSLAIIRDLGKGTEYTAEQMRTFMRRAAFDVAAATRFSASEAADAYYFLASAGMTAAQSIKALPAVAEFAQAGNFDLARATDLATDAQKALGMSSDNAQQNLKQLTRVTDVLVGANTLANASAEQFSVSLTTKAGAALRTVGKEIEEGVAVLAAFADQGTKGADAGTALNIVLRDLQTKAILNEKAFKRARVAVFDDAGEMRNMADIVGDLEHKLDGMSDRMKKATLMNLGFSDKSVIFIQTLLGMSGAIRDYETQLREMGGITKQVAEDQLTPFQRGWAKLTAAVSEAGAKLMDTLGPWLETSLTWLGDKIKYLSQLIPWAFEHWSEIGKTAWAVISIAVIKFWESALDVAEKLVRTFSGVFESLKAMAKATFDNLAALAEGSVKQVGMTFMALGRALGGPGGVLEAIRQGIFDPKVLGSIFEGAFIEAMSAVKNEQFNVALKDVWEAGKAGFARGSTADLGATGEQLKEWKDSLEKMRKVFEASSEQGFKDLQQSWENFLAKQDIPDFGGAGGGGGAGGAAGVAGAAGAAAGAMGPMAPNLQAGSAAALSAIYTAMGVQGVDTAAEATASNTAQLVQLNTEMVNLLAGAFPAPAAAGLGGISLPPELVPAPIMNAPRGMLGSRQRPAEGEGGIGSKDLVNVLKGIDALIRDQNRMMEDQEQPIVVEPQPGG